MILYGVTVYNAILIISYRIITYKLIYITVPEEHPGAYSMGWLQAQGSPAGLGLRKPRSGQAVAGRTQLWAWGVAGWRVRECGHSRYLARCEL